jgi:hypothetical protein
MLLLSEPGRVLNGDKDLIEFCDLLIGSMDAGNHDGQIVRDLSGCLDMMLHRKIIKPAEHKLLMESYVHR